MQIPTLTTPRSILRAFSSNDVDPLHRILGEEEVLRYFPPFDPPTRERVERRVAGILEHWEQHGFGLWAVTLRGTGAFVGRCGLQHLPETGEVEIDYLLGRASWGQGLATEAARAVLRFGFEVLRLERVAGIVHPENVASRRVLEKLGMTWVDSGCYFGMECRRYAVDSAGFDRTCPPASPAR